MDRPTDTAGADDAEVVAAFSRLLDWIGDKGMRVYGSDLLVVQARSALDRYRTACIAAQRTREGYVMVPREPTQTMLRAACKAMSPGRRPVAEQVSVMEKHRIRYRAMIATAPQDAASGEVGRDD